MSGGERSGGVLSGGGSVRNPSYPSIIAALRLKSFSYIQRDYDALVPFLRNHFLFPDPSDYFVQCA